MCVCVWVPLSGAGLQTQPQGNGKTSAACLGAKVWCPNGKEILRGLPNPPGSTIDPVSTLPLINLSRAPPIWALMVSILQQILRVCLSRLQNMANISGRHFLPPLQTIKGLDMFQGSPWLMSGGWCSASLRKGLRFPRRITQIDSGERRLEELRGTEVD